MFLFLLNRSRSVRLSLLLRRKQQSHNEAVEPRKFDLVGLIQQFTGYNP